MYIYGYTFFHFSLPPTNGSNYSMGLVHARFTRPLITFVFNCVPRSKQNHGGPKTVSRDIYIYVCIYIYMCVCIYIYNPRIPDLYTYFLSIYIYIYLIHIYIYTCICRYTSYKYTPLKCLVQLQAIVEDHQSARRAKKLQSDRCHSAALRDQVLDQWFHLTKKQTTLWGRGNEV